MSPSPPVWTANPSSEMAGYAHDPWARLLSEKLKLNPWRAGLVALGIGLFYLLLPATFGYLQTPLPGRLGSLDDWHSQILLLFMAPAVWFFYLWQPQALAKIDSRRITPWLWVIALGASIISVINDLPHLLATFGDWWAAANPLMIAIREGWVVINGYMLTMIALRHIASSHFGFWRINSINPQLDSDWMRGAESYSLAAALLWAILGVRLSIEVIELPARGGITPDFYLKVFLYLVLALFVFLAPLPKPPSRATVAKFALISLIPLPFLLLFWALGLSPQFAF